MEKKQTNTRRTFVKKVATAAAALTVPAIIPAHTFGANDRINIGFPGYGGEAVPTAGSRLEAIDAKTIVVRSVYDGRQSPTQKPADGEPAVADAGAVVRRQVEVVAENARRRKLRLTWPEIGLRLPPGVVNFALQSEGAKYSASSAATQIAMGTEMDRDARMATIRTRWQAQAAGQAPRWLSVAFSKPQEIDCVILRTFGEHVFGRNKEGIRDYHVQCLTAEGKLLTVASVRNNTKEYLIHRFPPVAAVEVRLVVRATNHPADPGWEGQDFCRLQDVEIYRLGSATAFAVETKSQLLSIEKQVAGRVAIFKDDVPMPEGVPSAPDHLAELLQQAGFGVTFLDFDMLANTSVLSKENFDLLIHPYGCSFPLATPLYTFLESGGHLLTLGGQAFTNAILRSPAGNLVATGYDPGIITTPGKMAQADWYRNLREQLGIFAGPKQTFVRALSARAVAGQQVIDQTIQILGEFAGYPATGLLGQVVPIGEEEGYVREGKELPYILESRKGTKQIGTMHRLAADYNYYLFNKTCARWTPLLEAYDRYDRPRGSAGAMILNHDGLYRGSIWAYFGVTNRDLFAPDNPAMNKALADIARFAMRGAFLHGLRSGYDCYRQGEKAEARVFVENFGSADRKARVRFLFLPMEGEEAVFQQEREIFIPKGKSTLVEVAWTPPGFDRDFYRVRCVLDLDGRPADEMQSGFVVWNEAAMQAKSSFRVNYQDNYFHDGSRPLFIIGTRTSDIHRVGQHGHDPLSRERQYQTMQDFGMSAVSPIYFQMYLPGFAWGKTLPELVPEPLLRQMDAMAQLCQRHKLIFAPCIFFENRHDCLKKEGIELSAKIAKLLGDRYCRVPGMVFYIWDDGVNFDGSRADQFIEFSRRCTEAFTSNPAGRRYTTLAEIYDTHNMGTRRVQEHLTIGSQVFHSYNHPFPVQNIAEARIADLRAAGKSLGYGEFDLWGTAYGNDAEHRLYLGYPHYYFGLGYSWILNWKWQDEDIAVIPWGIVFPCDRIAKGPACTYRNLSWFFRSFRPKYVQPGLMFVLPNAYWEKNKPPREEQDKLAEDAALPAEIDGQLLAHLNTIMGRGHVNLGVVDESDLPRLASTTKALIYPAAICPDEKTYAWLRDFVRGGGHLYVTGDLSYEPAEQHRYPERLNELAGVEPAIPLTEAKVPTVLAKAGRETAIHPRAAYGGWTQPYRGRVGLSLRATGAEVLADDDAGNPVVVRHKLGKGQVVFNADLTANAPGALIDAFLHDAAVARVATKPDSPETIRVFRVPTEDGTVYGVTSQGPLQSVTIDAGIAPVTLRLTRSPMVVAGFDTLGRLTACESDGLVKVGDHAIIEATASVMVFTLDGKPIGESGAVVLLPQPEVPANITIHSAVGIDLLEIGDVLDGMWYTRHQELVVSGPDGVRFHLDTDHSLCVVLLCCKAERVQQVEKLLAFLQGYLD